MDRKDLIDLVLLFTGSNILIGSVLFFTAVIAYNHYGLYLYRNDTMIYATIATSIMITVFRFSVLKRRANQRAQMSPY